MHARFIGLMTATAIAFSGMAATAAPEPEDPARQTPWHLYVDSREAYEMKQAQGDAVLLIDVREPVEIMFTGYTDVIDVNIPYMLVDPARWNPKKPVFMMDLNPDFPALVQAEMNRRGLDSSAPVLIMCRSGGERGAPAARALAPLGLENVYVVVDGFEGSTDKENPKGPWRLRNGWKNAGLPWGYDLNPDKIYMRPAD